VRTTFTTLLVRIATLALGTAGAVALFAAPAEAADLGSLSVVATGTYYCGSQTVEILPMSNEPVEGDYTVWAYASVWEPGRGWVNGQQWTRVDGITNLVFYGVTGEPGRSALLTYARYYDGGWHYAQEWIELSDALDNAAPFC
jgi:hypothetical protein